MLLGATAVSGAEYFLDLLELRPASSPTPISSSPGRAARPPDLQGKLPAAVALRAAPTPVIAVVGRNDLDDATANKQFADISPSPTSPTVTPPAIPHRTAELLQHIGTQIIDRLSLRG